MGNPEFWVMRRVCSRTAAARKQLDLSLHASADLGGNQYVSLGDNILTPCAGPFDEVDAASAKAVSLQHEYPQQTFHVVMNADL